MTYRQAIRDGRLPRPDTCENCGTECKPDASHDDYARPLTVAWLCRPCHITKDRHNRHHPEDPIMPATNTAAEKPWPHPWPKGGRPPKITNAVRWNLYVDKQVRIDAESRARDAGTELPDVMRALMADYAAGRVAPAGHAEPVPEDAR
jgi:hypothetical protein